MTPPETSPARPADPPRADPAGNERLTAMTGLVLLVLFAAECLTLLNLGQLLTLHVFLGMLLLAPVALKIGSTLWRFTRYYTRSPEYKRRGPPNPVQRVTGPFVIVTTAAVLGTGVMLIVEGGGPNGGGNWIQLHHEAFLLWALFIVIHLAAHLPELPRMLSGRVAGAATCWPPGPPAGCCWAVPWRPA